MSLYKTDLSPELICPLCGYKFKAEDAVCPTSCPLHSQCRQVCCPNCHYPMAAVEQSAVVAVLRSLGKRLKGEK